MPLSPTILLLLPLSPVIGVHHSSKRPCLADRATSFPIDMSKFSLFDVDRSLSSAGRKDSLSLIVRKRWSSDRGGTRRRCCSVGPSAAYATCSEIFYGCRADSIWELFVNGDTSWASDVSEAARNSRRDRDGGSGKRENLSNALEQVGTFWTTKGMNQVMGANLDIEVMQNLGMATRLMKKRMI